MRDPISAVWADILYGMAYAKLGAGVLLPRPPFDIDREGWGEPDIRHGPPAPPVMEFIHGPRSDHRR